MVQENQVPGRSSSASQVDLWPGQTDAGQGRGVVGSPSSAYVSPSQTSVEGVLAPPPGLTLLVLILFSGFKSLCQEPVSSGADLKAMGRRPGRARAQTPVFLGRKLEVVWAVTQKHVRLQIRAGVL